MTAISLYFFCRLYTIMPKKNHRRTKRARMRGGMLHLKDDALRAKQLMYAMLFSPRMQSQVPLGVQFEFILDNYPSCEHISDGHVLYYSATPMDYKKRMTTVHEMLDFYACSKMRELINLTRHLVDGCKAELELKESVASAKELVSQIQTTHLAPPPPLSRRISPLMFQPDPPLSPQTLMENFKLDVDNFAFKVANLYNLYYDKKRRGQPVYTHVSSEIPRLAHFKMRPEMERIKKSFEARLKMLEMLRDVALPEMIQKYHDDGDTHIIIPEALFSEDPIEFEEKVDEFRTQLDEYILQQKYILGLHVAPSRMLRTILHVPNRISSSSLRLAPPNAAINDLRHGLRHFTVDPIDIRQLKGQSALAKMLAIRLSSESNQPNQTNQTRKSTAQRLIGWHKKDNAKDKDP